MALGGVRRATALGHGPRSLVLNPRPSALSQAMALGHWPPVVAPGRGPWSLALGRGLRPSLGGSRSAPSDRFSPRPVWLALGHGPLSALGPRPGLAAGLGPRSGHDLGHWPSVGPLGSVWPSVAGARPSALGHGPWPSVTGPRSGLALGRSGWGCLGPWPSVGSSAGPARPRPSVGARSSVTGPRSGLALGWVWPSVSPRHLVQPGPRLWPSAPVTGPRSAPSGRFSPRSVWLALGHGPRSWPSVMAPGHGPRPCHDMGSAG